MNENIDVTSNFFAMVTHGQIFVGKSETDFYNALYNRRLPYCDVAVLKSLHEADLFAKNRYHALFYANPCLYSAYPMPMPLTQEYNLDAGAKQIIDANQESKSDSENRYDLRFCVPAVQTNVSAKLFWAVDGINGYGVTSDLNVLLHMLTNCGLDYPHAATHRTDYDAAIYARDSYVNRFIRRYGYTEIPFLFNGTLTDGDILVDSDYLNKEARLKSQALVTPLLSFGLL